MWSTLRHHWAAALGAVAVVAALLFLPGRVPSGAYAQTVLTPTPTAVATLPSVSGSNFQRTVSVSGSGSVNVQPDLAIVVLGVQNDAKTAGQALTDNSKQMQALVDALTKANVASADIRTQTIQLIPQYVQPTPVPQGQTQPQGQTGQSNQITGYTAMNTVQVTVRNISNLGSLLDQAVAAGGNTIQSISFDVSNQTQAMDQARDAAMKDALHKAQQLTTLAGVKVGPVVSLNESSHVPLPYQADIAQMRTAAAAVPVSPGTQAVTVDIQVTWEIQP